MADAHTHEHDHDHEHEHEHGEHDHDHAAEDELDPEAQKEFEEAQAEAIRRRALSQIRQYPDVALRMKAHEVDEFDEELVQLVERMQLLMHDAQGVGSLRRSSACSAGCSSSSQTTPGPRRS